jgi:hypothetical protein
MNMYGHIIKFNIYIYEYLVIWYGLYLLDFILFNISFLLLRIRKFQPVVPVPTVASFGKAVCTGPSKTRLLNKHLFNLLALKGR